MTWGRLIRGRGPSRCLLEDLVLLLVPHLGGDPLESGLGGGVPADLVPFRDGGPQPAVQRYRRGVPDGGPAELAAPAAARELWPDPDGDVDHVVVLRGARDAG